MSITFDDLRSWYEQTVRQREEAARTVPAPETPVEYARAALAQISNHDAVIEVLRCLVVAVEDLETRVGAKNGTQGTAQETTKQTPNGTAQDSGSSSSSSSSSSSEQSGTSASSGDTGSVSPAASPFAGSVVPGGV